jgi:predicted outer membrane repeat protein
MSVTRWLRSAAGVAAVAVALAGCTQPPSGGPPGPPTSIVVTTTADVLDAADGLVSLREAFIAASNDNADSTIVVASGAEYLLTSCGAGQLVHGGGRALVVTTDATARATVRQTCSPARVMVLGGSSVTLEHLSIRGGRASSPFPCGLTVYGQPSCARGAGITSSAPLVLDDVEVTDNRSIGDGSFEGGGVSARAGATVIDSEFSANYANRAGGAIASVGPLTISGSTFVSNSSGDGGALSVHDGSVTITGSEFRSNVAGSGGAVVLVGAALSATDTVFRLNTAGGGPGAAIWADSSVGSLVLERVAMVQNSGRTGALTLFAGVADVRIIDSSIVDNVATWAFRDQYNRAAGGIATLGASNITITGSTIAFNAAPPGGGANIDLPPANGTTVTVRSSIISDPSSSAANCELNGNLASVTDSLVTDATCGGPAAPAPPGLGALTQSGATWFRSPAPSGPAVDQLAPPCATGSDQRGVARPVGAGCDLGAIEG